MDNDAFYNEATIDKKKNKLLLNKNVLIIVIILVIIGLIILLYSLKGNNYSLEVEAPSIMYIDEPLDISVKLNGSEKYKDEAETSFFSEDDTVIELLETEFYGESGFIPIKPLSIGRDKINIISTIGADKYNKTLASKTIPIIVCPKFDDSLLTTKMIYIKRGQTYNLNINFGEKECSEIITYESKNNKIAQVNSSGEIKGIFLGQTQIIIHNGSADIVVYVNITQ